MAKKDISKFQKALLSKTNVIKAAPKKEEKVVEVPILVESDLNFKIEEETLTVYKALAKKHSMDLDVLVGFGLKFFLEFEDELFDGKSS